MSPPHRFRRLPEIGAAMPCTSGWRWRGRTPHLALLTVRSLPVGGGRWFTECDASTGGRQIAAAREL